MFLRFTHVIVAHSLLLHSFIPSYEYSTDYPIKCSWTFELFLIEAFMNKAIMNITVQVSFFFLVYKVLCRYVFSFSLGKFLRVKLLDSMVSMFYTL